MFNLNANIYQTFGEQLEDVLVLLVMCQNLKPVRKFLYVRSSNFLTSSPAQ